MTDLREPYAGNAQLTALISGHSELACSCFRAHLRGVDLCDVADRVQLLPRSPARVSCVDLCDVADLCPGRRVLGRE